MTIDLYDTLQIPLGVILDSHSNKNMQHFLPWRLKTVVGVDEESADVLKQPLRRTDVGQVSADDAIEKEAVNPENMGLHSRYSIPDSITGWSNNILYRKFKIFIMMFDRQIYIFIMRSIKQHIQNTLISGVQFSWNTLFIHESVITHHISVRMAILCAKLAILWKKSISSEYPTTKGTSDGGSEAAVRRASPPTNWRHGNCIIIGLPGKSILR